MNRDPVVFDEPHGYYGPAVIRVEDHAVEVTAELHVQTQRDRPSCWTGVLTGQTTDASTALYQLRREQFTLEVGDRRGLCGAVEALLRTDMPLQLRIVGIGPGPFRPADVSKKMIPDLADLNRLARERREGKHGDAHLRVHPGVWQVLRDQMAPPTPELFRDPLAALTALAIVMDDGLPPGGWQLTANADGTVREEGCFEVVRVTYPATTTVRFVRVDEEQAG